MKIIAIFFLAITVAFSQNVEPTQKSFDYKDIDGNTVNDGYLNGNLDYFKINNYTLGWHWGGQRKISKAMLANQSDIGTGWGIEPNDYYNSNTNLFVRASWADGYTEEIGGQTIYHEFWLYTHCKYDDQIMFTKSLCYSAALAHDPTDDYKLIKLTDEPYNAPDDPNNHIFGFKDKNPNCIVSQFPDNKWRLKVEDNISPNTEILSNPWPNNLLTYHDGGSDEIDDNFSGRAFYVSINLRRLYDEDGFEDVDVLKIEVPYTYLDHIDVYGNNVYYTRTAKFRQIPSDQLNDFDNPNGYGLRWNLTYPLEDEPQMIVKEYMLPSTTEDNGDITISGYIEFTGLDFSDNARLKQHNLQVGVGQIDQLNLKVTYMGNCAVAINWIKFETPNTRKLLNGDYDNLIEDGIQDDMTKLTDPSYSSRGIQPSRFIINVEGSPINWAAERHFSKLVGNIITGQSGASLPAHYDYYINPADKWYSYAKMTPHVANPFCKSNSYQETYEAWKHMGITQGYKKKRWDNGDVNRYTSEWETFLRYRNDLTLSQLFDDLKDDTDIYTNDEKVKYAGGPISTQAYWEWNLYTNYFKKFSAGFQYSDIPWFAQTFVEGFIFPAPVNSTQYSYCASHPNGTRVITGEEFQLMNWNPIIMGAKGLLYDGDTDNPATMDIKLNPSTKIMMTKFGLDTLIEADYTYFYDQIDDIDYLSSVYSTSDFLDNSYDHFNFEAHVYNKQTVANTMGVLIDRIFMGKKSVRLEMRKLHDWVRNNEGTLMNLKLQAWFGKGYTVLYNQRRTFASDSMFKKFVRISDIRTRKLYGITANGYTGGPEEEPIQESFFDVTLLCDKNDTVMTNTFYIGVQNRRSDPFIYLESENETDKWLHLTTSEFDNICNLANGANNPVTNTHYTQNEWKDLYYKRLGCREITIPFNYCDPNNGNDYNLLHVTELKDSTATNPLWPWWRQEKFNNAVDVVIGQNGSLPVNFLPGEGKIFKVEVLKPEPLSGNLAYSNQSKFVVFPEYDGNNNPTDVVRYHLTYTKPNTDPSQYKNGIMSVFYRRSAPMAKVTNKENLQIDWEQELCVSDNIFIYGFRTDHTFPGSPTSPIVPCYYPSMVVRREGSSTKAYVVFSAEAEGQFICTDLYCPPDIDECYDVLNPICEAILNVAGTTVTWNGQANAIQNVVHGFRDNYGTPVINASYSGNYYAWSDSLCGIGVGYKAIGNTNTTKTSLKAINGFASHPSINVYSILGKEENDCSIVWQEKSTLNSQPYIYYTKLRMNGGILDHFLPTNIYNLNDIWNDCLRLSSNISGEMPTIYRILQTQDAPDAPDEVYAVREVIAWNSNPKLSILRRSLLNLYDEGETEPYYLSFASPIRKIIGNSSTMAPINLFSNPVMSQITSYNLGNSLLPVGGSQYEYLLNFEDNWDNNVLGSGNKIFHLRENFHQLDLKISDFKKIIYPVAEGQYPHLAYSPVENENGNVWKNHRVYNQGVMESYDRIVPNPIYFHPYNDCPSCHSTQSIVGFDTDPFRGGGIGNTSMSFPSIPVPTPLPINLPYQAVSDSLGEYVIPVEQDTIYTDWVLIDSTAELQYLSSLRDTTTVLFKLQKLSDSSFVDLPAPYTPGVIFSHQVFYLVNGNNDQYRLAMINTDSTLEYGENMYFDAPFVIDTIYAKSSFEVKQNVINLNKHILADKTFNLSCMPNPAKEILNVAVYANQNTNVESVVLQLYNQQGMMVWENNFQINSTAAIPVDDFSNGMYLIRANITTKDGFYTETSKVLILK
ncbi:MAG: T9SS type A sorting domain-containing protein [Candidatus Kapabacteria bacterium]|nr:T9SS type A sorting domain-containing protein [Candidatus Kapabacteria bacterium]